VYVLLTTVFLLFVTMLAFVFCDKTMLHRPSKLQFVASSSDEHTVGGTVHST